VVSLQTSTGKDSEGRSRMAAPSSSSSSSAAGPADAASSRILALPRKPTEGSGTFEASDEEEEEEGEIIEGREAKQESRGLECLWKIPTLPKGGVARGSAVSSLLPASSGKRRKTGERGGEDAFVVNLNVDSSQTIVLASLVSGLSEMASAHSPSATPSKSLLKDSEAFPLFRGRLEILFRAALGSLLESGVDMSEEEERVVGKQIEFVLRQLASLELGGPTDGHMSGEEQKEKFFGAYLEAAIQLMMFVDSRLPRDSDSEFEPTNENVGAFIDLVRKGDSQEENENEDKEEEGANRLALEPRGRVLLFCLAPLFREGLLEKKKYAANQPLLPLLLRTPGLPPEALRLLWRICHFLPAFPGWKRDDGRVAAPSPASEGAKIMRINALVTLREVARRHEGFLERRSALGLLFLLASSPLPTVRFDACRLFLLHVYVLVAPDAEPGVKAEEEGEEKEAESSAQATWMLPEGHVFVQSPQQTVSADWCVEGSEEDGVPEADSNRAAAANSRETGGGKDFVDEKVLFGRWVEALVTLSAFQCLDLLGFGVVGPRGQGEQSGRTALNGDPSSELVLPVPLKAAEGSFVDILLKRQKDIARQSADPLEGAKGAVFPLCGLCLKCPALVHSVLTMFAYISASEEEKKSRETQSVKAKAQESADAHANGTVKQEEDAEEKEATETDEKAPAGMEERTLLAFVLEHLYKTGTSLGKTPEGQAEIARALNVAALPVLVPLLYLLAYASGVALKEPQAEFDVSTAAYNNWIFTLSDEAKKQKHGGDAPSESVRRAVMCAFRRLTDQEAEVNNHALPQAPSHIPLLLVFALEEVAIDKRLFKDALPHIFRSSLDRAGLGVVFRRLLRSPNSQVSANELLMSILELGGRGGAGGASRQTPSGDGPSVANIPGPPPAMKRLLEAFDACVNLCVEKENQEELRTVFSPAAFGVCAQRLIEDRTKPLPRLFGRMLLQITDKMQNLHEKVVTEMLPTLLQREPWNDKDLWRGVKTSVNRLLTHEKVAKKAADLVLTLPQAQLAEILKENKNWAKVLQDRVKAAGRSAAFGAHVYELLKLKKPA